MIAEKSKFTVERIPGVWEGYHFTDAAATWNGHPSPLFPKEVVLKMIESLEGISVKLRHVKERDTFEEADEDGVYHVIYPEYIQTREGLKTLYPIGNQSWPWEEVEVK